MSTQKLAEALKEIRSRECLIIKAGSVQEAICELFEAEDPASLIICDQQLRKSLPRRELRTAADLKEVPFLVAAHNAEREEEELLAEEGSELPAEGPLATLMHKLRVVKIPEYELDAQLHCIFA